MNKLITKDLDYKDEVMKYLNNKIKITRTFFNILRVITFFGAFATVTIVALIMGRVFIGFYPAWFFFATASITASLAFITSLINFFVLRENMDKYRTERRRVKFEILKYENNISERYAHGNKQYNLNIAIGEIIGSKAAKKELSNV